MLKALKTLAGVLLAIVGILIVREAPSELMRAYESDSVIPYLLALMVGLFLSFGSSALFLRSAFRRQGHGDQSVD